MFRFVYWIISNSIKLVITVVLIGGFAVGWMIIDGLNDSSVKLPVARCDVGVVMGINLTQVGEPTGGLKERLDKGIELYRLGLFPMFYLVGSDRPEQRGMMARYLVKQHVPAQAIIEEPSDETDASAQNIAKACKTHHFQSILLITQYFHLSRAKLCLKHYGLQNIQQVHAGRLEIGDWLLITREFFAFAFYLVDYELQPLWAKLASTKIYSSTVGTRAL